MTPTSASCHPRGEPRAAFGFSLLEMLVVLALISVMTALAAPRLASTVRAIGTSGDRAEVQRQIEDLPLRARLQSGEIRLGAEAALSPLLELPQGWAVSTLTPLLVRDNGVCDAARLRVRSPDAEEEWVVAMPDCQVRNAQ